MASKIQKANETIGKYNRTKEAIAKIKLGKDDPRNLIDEEFKFIVLTLIKYSPQALDDLIEYLERELEDMEADKDD